MLPLAAEYFQVETVRHWLQKGGYGALFGLLFSCGLGMPLPEDIPLIAAGILIARHFMHFAVAAPLAWLGIVGGDCILYTLGYHFGEKIAKIPFIGKHVTLVRLKRAEGLFRKYGVWMVAVGRLFMGIRGAMVVAAGTSRLKFIKFIIADGLAAIVSGGLFMYLGYWGGKNGREVIERAREFRHILMGVAGVFAIGLFLFFYFRSRKNGDVPDPSPADTDTIAGP
jgi:membrane protein DedA with SNARE-associated domain